MKLLRKKRIASVVLALVIIFTGRRTFLRNFHVVDEGRLYRSALLTPSEMEEYIKQYKIKTVINLQGSHPDDEWYIEEADLLKKMKVNLVDIPMRTERIPTHDEIKKLFAAYDSMPRPLLIHCNSGADRTGEASAIYEMEYMKKTKAQALEMLSPLYFHFSLWVPAKMYFMGLYKGKKWALDNYDPCKQGYDYFEPARECHGPETPSSRMISSELHH